MRAGRMHLPDEPILSIEDIDLIVASYGMDALVIKAIEHIEMIEL